MVSGNQSQMNPYNICLIGCHGNLRTKKIYWSSQNSEGQGNIFNYTTKLNAAQNNIRPIFTCKLTSRYFVC